ncbi:MAG: SusC/RagA family TonB-linked outer membrane protein, partial [Tannerellaceae bacterium]|nr:SusC/RagA family TonB-linked outer membrane protein [Tannerellaceae bacterium]
MRISALLLLIGILSVSATSYSQEAKVSISVTDKTVKDVFEEIKAQTNYSFWYDLKDVNANRKVNVNVENESVKNVLAKVLEDQNLEFELKGNHIVIMKKSISEAKSGVPVVAQDQKRISGTIKDEKGGAIIGANVIVKGTSIGTTSDIDGRFSFEVPSNSILQISYIGYLSQEMHTANKTVLDITMIEDAKSLEEVVVVGYGVQKKETLTGSISSVKGTDIVIAPVTNVTHTLAGRLPGVVAVTRSGEPGADGATIRIRGTNTLGDNNALIVVDGIPGRSLDRIDPNSVESITVLKDASAAIYGAQAANGVILITTKRGEAGKPQITIQGNMGIHQPTVLPSLLNASEYATALNELDMYKNRPERYTADDIRMFSDGSDPWKYPNTDWFGETFKKWSTQTNVNAEISGGSQFMRYFVSGGAKNQEAIYKNSATRYNQYDLRANMDMEANKHIRFGLDIAGRIEDRNYPMGNNGVTDIFRMLMRGKPNTPAYWPNGLPGPDIEYGSNPVVVTTDQTGYDRDKRYIFNSNFKLDISIPWV